MKINRKKKFNSIQSPFDLVDDNPMDNNIIVFLSFIRLFTIIWPDLVATIIKDQQRLVDKKKLIIIIKIDYC